MKNSLVSKLAGKQSKEPAARTGNTLAFAHYLGLPSRVTEVAKVAPAKVQAVAANALRKPAPAQRSAKTAPVATKASANAPKAALRQKSAMPFSQAMGIGKPATRDQHSGTTQHWPEMVNGVPTGRFIEVQHSKAEAPKLDASTIARRIIAAGKRAFGK